MHPIRFSYTPAALNASGLAAAVAESGGGYALSATTPADSLAHLITVTGIAATDHSGKTFTITGTDANDVAQSEAIAGPNGAVAVSSTLYFKTVTSVTVSATTGADTFNIGWTGVAVGPTYPLNWRDANYQVALGVIITGTVNVTVQHTMDGLHGEYVASPGWFPHSWLAAISASADGNYDFPAVATRLLINSVTAGATVAFVITQG